MSTGIILSRSLEANRAEKKGMFQSMKRCGYRYQTHPNTIDNLQPNQHQANQANKQSAKV
jgi:hypothetical protein